MPSTLLRRPLSNLQALVFPGYALLAAAITLLAFFHPIYAIGLALAFGALVLTWKRPDIALMLIVVAAPFQKDLGGSDRDIVGAVGNSSIAFSLAELLFAATLPAFLLNNLAQKRSLRIGPITVPVCLYL